jgi:hypothetical protein
VTKIQDAAQLQTTSDSKDKTSTKSDKRKAQTILTLQLTVVLKAYFDFKADKTHQNLLASVGQASLKSMADTNFVTKCRDIYDLAMAQPIADLVPYGVTAAWLASYHAGLLDFTNFIPNPRLTMVDKAAATSMIAAGFTEAKTGLDKITGLVDILQYQDAAFYRSFQQVMRVINIGSRVLAFRVLAADIAGNAVRNCDLTLLRKSDGKVFEYATNDNGTLQRRFLQEAVYTVTISKLGYTPLSGDITLESGETYLLEVLVDTVDRHIVSARNPKTGEMMTMTVTTV